MGIVSFVLSLWATAIILIFSVFFIILVYRWGMKRTKEISKRFDADLEGLKNKEDKVQETRRHIVELKVRRKAAVRQKDAKTVKFLDREIEKQEKKRDKVLRDISERY